jgi:hypothetical protein
VAALSRSNPIKERFAALLKARLTETYGRIPSAIFLAKEFNLRAYDTEPITQEAFRRWLHGVSMPGEVNLRILINWLHLDISACFAKPNGGGHMIDHHSSSKLKLDAEVSKLAIRISRLSRQDREILQKLVKQLERNTRA